MLIIKSKTRQLLLLALIAISCWFVGYQIERYAHHMPILSNYVEDLEKEVHNAESAINHVFSNASFLMQATNNELPQDSIDKYMKVPYTLLIYNDQDSLLYWSNNRVAPYFSDIRFSEEEVHRLNETAGSQYLLIKKPYEIVINQEKYRYALVGLIPLYLRYPISNGYLTNHFPLMPDLFSQYVKPSDEIEGEEQIIRDTEGNELLQLKAKSIYPYRNIVVWAFLFYLISSLSLLLLFYKLGALVTQSRGVIWGLLLFVSLIFSFRFISVFAELPKAATSLDLFQLQFSISNNLWFYSLGDFLVDVGLFIAVAIFIVHQWRFEYIRRWTIVQQWLFAIATYSFIVGGFSFIQIVLKDIVLNSNIYFEFEDFSKLDKYSFVALVGVVSLFVAFFLISNKIYRLLIPLRFPYSVHAAIGGGVILIAIVIGLSVQFSTFNTLYIAFFSIAFSILLMWFVQLKQLTFIWVSSWLLFFAAISTVLLEEANMEKSRMLRKDFLYTVTYEQDSRVEEAFFRLSRQIQDDDFFKVYFSSMYIPYSQVVERLTYLYLDNEFFGRYQYNIHMYSASGNPKKGEHMPYNQLQNMIEAADSTVNDYLFFYTIPDGEYSYIAHIPIEGKGNKLGSIAIELKPKKKGGETSIYIELLSLSKSRLEKNYENFAYALYKNNQRVASRDGNFPAFLSFEYPIPEQGEYLVQKRENKKYLLYRDKQDYIAMVELGEESWLKPLSIFSYLFCSGIIAIILMALFVWVARYFFKIKILPIKFQASLRERIQQGIVVVSLLSFVAIGFITIIYFQNEYTDYHKSRLKRKISSAEKTASWQIINSSDSLDKIPDAKELANIHKMDVNVFDLQGQLLSTSEDAVFERRLLSRRMHPTAFHKMKHEQLASFSHTERIDDFEYLSGYVPLKNKKGEVIAYLNLPYDLAGSKNIRSQDVAEFLGALLNVYVIFLLLAGLVAFLIANSVTRPLSVIGEKLRLIKVGEKNEPIIWKSKDEIGNFVARFNDMIKALEESTQELARTQRESAWRDMAKQVAHEIKNPLTPMKLQIQMLERAAEKDPEKAQKMMKRVAKTLVEQIDNLAHIASEFSNFAKMPVAQNEHFTLNPMVEGVYTLFHEEENVQLRLNMIEEELNVFADKSQILRVLNNLVKNAIQAIPDDRPGIISLALYEKDGYAVIKVSDNGVGIPADKHNDIFTPYFTTKSSGTGIGLAMSKNIVEIAKGRIYFESKVNVGTDFYVELPIQEDKTS
jgi:two-component system nitrogen regulation sensor histidine kinase NtrY